jgi:cytoskeletal protein CcmA (bactofilin family)
MSLFSKPAKTAPAPMSTREKAARNGAGGDTAISIIGPGMNIVGDLSTDGTVRIEGRVEGRIQAGKAVVLGKGGEVVGDILTQDAVIGGRIKGLLVAESRLELQASAEIEGEIHARAQHLQLNEGARFNGQVRMIDEGSGPMRALPAESFVTAEAV